MLAENAFLSVSSHRRAPQLHFQSSRWLNPSKDLNSSQMLVLFQMKYPDMHGGRFHWFRSTQNTLVDECPLEGSYCRLIIQLVKSVEWSEWIRGNQIDALLNGHT